MTLWSSLPTDVLICCVQKIEQRRRVASAADSYALTRMLDAMSLVCKSWRRVVYNNLTTLAPRGTFQMLPTLVKMAPKVQVLDLCRCKPWAKQDFHDDPVGDFPEDSRTLYSTLNVLSRLTNLKELQIRHINDTAVPFIASLTSLQSLYLGGYLSFTNEGIQSLSQLTNLQTLIIDGGGRLESTGYQFLSSLSFLRRLELWNCRLEDNGLEYLAKLTNLTHVSLASCQYITGSGFHHLGGLSSLESLDLSGTDVCPEALYHLQRCQKLKTLNLNFCHQLLPSNTISSLSHLSISSLTMMRCESLTLESIVDLKNKLPDCSILFQKSGDVNQEHVQFLK